MHFIRKYFLQASAILAMGLSSSVFAATGGGAIIHNAASMTFTGGQVTAYVNVEVLTIGTTPSFTSTNTVANSGDSVNITYTITSNSNGSDIYDMSVSTNDTDVTAPAALSLSPTQVTLGGSITSQPSTAGTIYIPAGSESNFTAGDTIRLNIGGNDYLYTVDSVTAGTSSSTVGNTTTPETPTAIVLTPVGIAPAIAPGNVPVGTQVGEVQTITVSITAGDPTTPGVDGTHEVVIDGTVAAPGPGGPGDVIIFSDVGSSNLTVLSGDATLIKEVRNVTDGGAFATSGVTARTGDTLEYRITAASVPGQNVTGASLTDSIPDYITYVPNSTTLNGAPQADIAGVSPVVGGMDVNSPTGGAGEINDGETAVIIFQVTVD